MPENWKCYKSKQSGDIYYFNSETGESIWDHPCDEQFKQEYINAVKKIESGDKIESNDKEEIKIEKDSFDDTLSNIELSKITVFMLYFRKR